MKYEQIEAGENLLVCVWQEADVDDVKPGKEERKVEEKELKSWPPETQTPLIYACKSQRKKNTDVQRPCE